LTSEDLESHVCGREVEDRHDSDLSLGKGVRNAFRGDLHTSGTVESLGLCSICMLGVYSHGVAVARNEVCSHL
jgi:hypothetical protein